MKLFFLILTLLPSSFHLLDSFSIHGIYHIVVFRCFLHTSSCFLFRSLQNLQGQPLLLLHCPWICKANQHQLESRVLLFIVLNLPFIHSISLVLDLVFATALELIHFMTLPEFSIYFRIKAAEVASKYNF